MVGGGGDEAHALGRVPVVGDVLGHLGGEGGREGRSMEGKDEKLQKKNIRYQTNCVCMCHFCLLPSLPPSLRTLNPGSSPPSPGLAP